MYVAFAYYSSSLFYYIYYTCMYTYTHLYIYSTTFPITVYCLLLHYYTLFLNNVPLYKFANIMFGYVATKHFITKRMSIKHKYLPYTLYI